jgi:hypothetical protein
MDVDNWHWRWDNIHASGGIVQSFLKPQSSRATKANLRRACSVWAFGDPSKGVL